MICTGSGTVVGEAGIEIEGVRLADRVFSCCEPTVSVRGNGEAVAVAVLAPSPGIVQQDSTAMRNQLVPIRVACLIIL